MAVKIRIWDLCNSGVCNLNACRYSILYFWRQLSYLTVVNNVNNNNNNNEICFLNVYLPKLNFSPVEFRENGD